MLAVAAHDVDEGWVRSWLDSHIVPAPDEHDA